MDFQNTQPAPLSALSGDARDDFRVSHPREVQGLLRQLADANVIIHLAAPDGSGYGTTLWTVDATQGKLSFSVDPASPQLRSLVDAGEATAVAYLDSIKLQFDLQHLVLVHGKNASALQAAWPAVMYRFQRRDSFRVRTLPRSAPTAHLRHPSMPDMSLALRVLDVSTGGCALLLPGDVPALAPGVRLERVRIELDPDTRFETALTLQHVSGGFNPNNNGSRLGCAFASLDGMAQRTLQRYIDQTQKRQRAMALG